MRHLNRYPEFDELRYLCVFIKAEDSAIITVRSARGRKLVEGLPDTIHSYLDQYFFVRCPSSFLGIWRKGVLPVPIVEKAEEAKESKFKAIYDVLKQVDKKQRYMKFLLTNEFLHQYELLHSSRLVRPVRDSPNAPTPLVEPSDLPASQGTSTSMGPSDEASQEKRSEPMAGIGTSTPVTTVEETMRPAVQVVAATEPGVRDPSTVFEHEEEGGSLEDLNFDSIYGDLSDLEFTRQELIGVGGTPVAKKSTVQTASLPSTPTPAVTSTVSVVVATSGTPSGTAMGKSRYYSSFRDSSRQSYDPAQFVPRRPPPRESDKERQQRHEEEERRRESEERARQQRRDRYPAYDSSHSYSRDRDSEHDESRKRPYHSDKGKGIAAAPPPPPPKRPRTTEVPSSAIQPSSKSGPQTSSQQDPKPSPLTDSDLEIILKRGKYTLPAVPPKLKEKFPEWYLRGVRFDLDLTPLDHKAMLRDVEAMRHHVDQMLYWQKLVDELQMVNRANAEALATLELDREAWSQTWEERKKEHEVVLAQKAELETEIRRLKDEHAAAMKLESQKIDMLQAQVKDAHVSQQSTEVKLREETKLAETRKDEILSLREINTSITEINSLQAQQIKDLQAQVAALTKERDQAISARKDSEQALMGTVSEVNETLFEFYVRTTLGRGSLSFLKNDFAVTLAEVWEEVLIRHVEAGSGYSDEELQGFLLDETSRAALVEGRAILAERRTKAAGAGTSSSPPVTPGRQFVTSPSQEQTHGSPSKKDSSPAAHIPSTTVQELTPSGKPPFDPLEFEEFLVLNAHDLGLDIPVSSLYQELFDIIFPSSSVTIVDPSPVAATTPMSVPVTTPEPAPVQVLQGTSASLLATSEHVSSSVLQETPTSQTGMIEALKDLDQSPEKSGETTETEEKTPEATTISMQTTKGGRKKSVVRKPRKSKKTGSTSEGAGGEEPEKFDELFKYPDPDSPKPKKTPKKKHSPKKKH